MLQAEDRASAKKKAVCPGACEIVLLFSLPLLQVTTGHYLVIITYFHEVIRFWLNRILCYSWENPVTDFIL